MSLHRLKETLHACSSSSSQPQTQPRSPPPPALLQRRPPKTSLSEQLLRLEAAAGSSSSSFSSRIAQLPPVPRPPIEKPREDDEPTPSDEEEERRIHPISRPRPPPLPAAALQSRGPYEPLVLSPPGEHPVVQVPPSINCRLLAHQRDGVRFLYNLYRNNHGGVLGDDMGLGKTIQTIAFLSSVIGKGNGHEQSSDKGKKTGPVLILCPTSVIRNWENEFSEWAEFSVAVYHGPNRELVLQKIETQGLEVLITSFDTFRIHDKILCGISWELVVVDEAHRLKNEKSKLYTACLGITTQKRFGLTGTIMQNKIMELFNLFDWVVPGCLGDREHFRGYYDEPLKQGQRVSAPERFVQVADARKKHLVSVLRKFLLRRTKEETIGHLMLGKEDNIVFCKMSDVQKRVYRRMLQQPDIQILINKDLRCSCGSPLPQVECCKKTEPNGIIWSYLHRDNPDGCPMCPFCLVLPCLVKLQQISNHLELIKPNPKDEVEKQKKDAELAAAVFGADVDLVGGSAKSENFMGLSDAEHCGKMRALERLLSLWTQQGDKILLFSYSVRMLDILEKFLIRKGYCFSRFDGTTPMNARQSLVDEFNRSPSKQVFLISTRAGNLGVNLVSANRVVIFDPSWNPAQDLQAQDRSFRYGQRRHVTVFRLLGAGSLEELVYSRQIYKQQLSNIAVSGKIEKRYFEGVQDDRKFQGELFGICNLFRDLSDKLFTSEIIEMHGEHCNSSATEATGIREIVDTDLFGSQENRKCATATTDSDNQKLVDFGIVYAHRNEDVVNMGTNRRDKDGTNETVESSSEELQVKDETKHTVKIKSSSLEQKTKVVKFYSLEQKRKQFSRIASFMGMDDLEFSKWLLAASPIQRSEVLQKFKRKKKVKVCDVVRRTDELILDSVEPHANLQKLCISHFSGSRIPYWIAESRVKNLVNLDFYFCAHIEELPSLGKLLKLKDLTLCGLTRLRRIGQPLLHASVDGFMELSLPPSLQKLEVDRCLKLEELPLLPPSLMRLDIREVGLIRLPRVVKLHTSSDETISSKWLDIMIRSCQCLTSLEGSLFEQKQCIQVIREISIIDCMHLESAPFPFEEMDGLREIQIENCPKLRLLRGAEDKLRLSSLRWLTMGQCGDLELLLLQSLQGFTNLSYLSLDNCSVVESLPSADVFEHLTSLRTIRLNGCGNLSSLGGLRSLPRLEYLEIRKCSKLTEISKSLTSSVSGCEEEPRSFTQIETIEIDHSSLLLVEPVRSLCRTRHLTIRDGSEMLDVMEPWLLRNCASLQYLDIVEVNLESLPVNISELSSLESLRLYGSDQLRSLPNLPSSLQRLYIWTCHPELREKATKRGSLEWNKISHIPHVEIGGCYFRKGVQYNRPDDSGATPTEVMNHTTRTWCWSAS